MIVDLLSKYAECDGVLLSGGIDSTLVAYAARRIGHVPVGITVSLVSCQGDLPFALYAAARLSTPLSIVQVRLVEALDYVERAMEVLKNFNAMELVNCAVQYAGLERARDLGLRRVCTGDGGDELFLGYSFYRKYSLHALEEKRREIVAKWRFCSRQIAQALGLEAVLPFTENEVVKFALALPAAEVLDKKPLREALKGVAPLIAARRKTPLEEGSCFNRLYEEMEKRAGSPYAYLCRLFEAKGFQYLRSAEGCPRCGYAQFDGYCSMCGYYEER